MEFILVFVLTCTIILLIFSLLFLIRKLNRISLPISKPTVFFKKVMNYSNSNEEFYLINFSDLDIYEITIFYIDENSIKFHFLNEMPSLLKAENFQNILKNKTLLTIEKTALNWIEEKTKNYFKINITDNKENFLFTLKKYYKDINFKKITFKKNFLYCIIKDPNDKSYILFAKSDDISGNTIKFL